ncbi:MAG: BON domain-containing protein [Xanthomonadales bacterium]|nr:BON domain-containing protein [Xanthomonadales bacterium]
MYRRILTITIAAALATACAAPEPYADQNPDAADTGVAIVGEEPVATDSDEFYRTDAQIRTAVENELVEAGLDDVTVRVINGDVYLSGWTRSAGDRELAVNVARDVNGVEEVFARDVSTW